MSSAKVEDICRQLVRLQLAPQAQVDDCLDRLGRKNAHLDEVLQCLENKGCLTSFQIGKIEKGELQELVLGHFKLMYRNASGSFARVYRAVDLRNGKMVGLKVLRQRWADDPKAMAEFHREAELGRALQHPNVVPIYEVGKSGNQHFFSMEFVEGGNLRDFINIRKKVDPKEALKYVRDMAEGLHYALGKGATHRDLKMTNVLMSSQGVAKLVDFGLAGGPIDDPSGGESAQRALDYATLEKNTGAQRDDPRSDLYFLGCIFYELVTGVSPLTRTRDRVERSQFSRYLEVAPVRSLEPGLPRCVANIIDKLMQLNPALRYQTPAELLRDVRSAISELESNNASGAYVLNGTGGTSVGPDSDVPLITAVRTIMCIEDRHKQQDVLREYFSKHGYRVLVLSDINRGLSRLEQSPPDCMIVMGDALGEPCLKGFVKAQQMQRDISFGLVLVLSDKQAAWKDELEQTAKARVVVQPVTLRELRKTAKKTMAPKRDDDTHEFDRPPEGK